MTPTKLLVSQILAVAAIVVAAIWFATQWAVASFCLPARTRHALVPAPRHAGLGSLLDLPWWLHFDA